MKKILGMFLAVSIVLSGIGAFAETASPAPTETPQVTAEPTVSREQRLSRQKQQQQHRPQSRQLSRLQRRQYRRTNYQHNLFLILTSHRIST